MNKHGKILIHSCCLTDDMETLITNEFSHFNLNLIKDDELLGWIEFVPEGEVLYINTIYVVEDQRKNGLAYHMLDNLSKYFINTSMSQKILRTKQFNPIASKLINHIESNGLFNNIKIQNANYLFLSDMQWIEGLSKGVYNLKVANLVKRGILHNPQNH